MRLNPVIDESIGVYFRSRPYRTTHAVYLGLLGLMTIVVWPGRGFMEFFSTASVPAAFEVLSILQLLLLTGIGMYSGMERLASTRIISYTEWLDHTSIPILRLAAGKILAAVLHTVLLVLLASPFLFIAAGPGGIPVRAVFSTQLVILLIALFCRVAGMSIALLGERRDVIRIVGSWIFLALLYLATLQVLQPVNPIIAVARQQNERSPLVSTVAPVPLAEQPALPAVIAYVAGIALAAGLLLLGMHRHRVKTERLANG